jgi:thiol-disulfide isomerase/thioredoxin
VKRTVMITSLAVLVVVIGLSAFLGTRHEAPQASEVKSALLGKMAPTFSGDELGGGQLSLKNDAGHVVVVSFWASWCGPCVSEAPNLSEFAWSERHHGVNVIGVVWDDTVSAATAFQTHYGSLYPSIIDPNGAIANSYGVTAPPTTFVINAQGRVAATLFGAVSEAQLVAIVNRVKA